MAGTKKPYGSPTEVDISDVPSNYRFADPMRKAFVQDVILRLERTAKTKAIRYPFKKDKKLAESYRQSIHRKVGHGKVRCSLVARADRFDLYIWHKSE